MDEYEEIKKYFRNLYENNIINVSILTKNECELIIKALENGFYTCDVKTYIFMLNDSNKKYDRVKISEISKEKLEKMAYLIAHCLPESHPQLLMDEIIYPIFDDDCTTIILNEIASITTFESGQQWLDSYYF